jgi:hypothetical protein
MYNAVSYLGANETSHMDAKITPSYQNIVLRYEIRHPGRNLF